MSKKPALHEKIRLKPSQHHFLNEADDNLRAELEEMRQVWWRLPRNERLGCARIAEMLQDEYGIRVSTYALRKWLNESRPTK